MSFRKFVFYISLLAVFAMSARVSVDSDTWWHLRAGKWIVKNRAVPRTDSFSYTRAGEPWEYPGWLVEVPMYWIYSAFGAGGLNLWTAAMVTLTFGFVWSTLSGGPFLRAFVIVLAAAASGIYWAARPYLVTFLFAAVYLWVLEKERKQAVARSHNDRWFTSKHLWLLPLLMVIWVNSHGGFAVGFLLVGVYIIGSFDRKEILNHQPTNLNPFIRYLRPLFLMIAFMILAVCINPYGPAAMLLYPFRTVGIEAVQDYIQEWQPPNFRAAQVQPFVWLLLLTLGAVGASGKRLSLTDFSLVGGFAYLSFMAGRNIALFAVVVPMVLTKHAQPILQRVGRSVEIQKINRPRGEDFRGSKILNLVILVILVLAVGIKSGLVYPELTNEEVFQESLPVHAVEFLRAEHPDGRLFNSYNWGAYLLWALPEYPVFVDGRTDLFGDEVISQWLQVVAAQDGWQGVLEQWDVGIILLEPQRPVVGQLAYEGWKLRYEDEIAVIYTR